MLSGAELLPILAITKAEVKWLNPHGRIVGRITAQMAHHMVRAGSFVGKCSPRKVHFIREVEDIRQPNVADFEYRQDRAMLQPCPVTMKSVLAWEKWAEQHANCRSMAQAV